MINKGKALNLGNINRTSDFCFNEVLFRALHKSIEEL
jgi:hypothetical protein